MIGGRVKGGVGYGGNYAVFLLEQICLFRTEDAAAAPKCTNEREARGTQNMLRNFVELFC